MSRLVEAPSEGGSSSSTGATTQPPRDEPVPSRGNLRELVRSIVQRDVLRASAATASSSWLVMVLDAEASRVLTPVLGMYDLAEERVALVEALEKRRQPFPQFDVVYVAGARDASVRQITADWNAIASNRGGQLPYACAHAFFLSRLSDAQMRALGACASLASRLRTLSELNLDFLAVERQAFALAEPRAFAVSGATALAMTDGGVLEPSEREAARKLATLAASLSELSPVFRHRRDNDRAKAFCEETARRLVRDNNTAKNTNSTTPHQAESRGPATILVLDRADDPLTPLLHEYTYQALVQDMLDTRGDAKDTVAYAQRTKAGEVKDEIALLNEKDAVWVEFRHRHVASVVYALRKRVADFLAHNADAAALARGNKAGNHTKDASDLSLTDMASALRRMPEFQAATATLNKHMTLASECLSKFQAFSLLETSQLEQTLATGQDDEGETVRSPKDLIADVAELCAKVAGSAPAVTEGSTGANDHALRLAAVYFVARGGRLSADERNRLFAALSPSPRQQAALLALSKLVAGRGGVPAKTDALKAAKVLAAIGAGRSGSRGQGRSTMSALRSALRSAARGASSSSAAQSANNPEDDVAASRYVPPAKTLIEAAARDRLPEDLYASLGASSSSSGADGAGAHTDAGLSSSSSSQGTSAASHQQQQQAQQKVTAQSVRTRGKNRFAAATVGPGGDAAKPPPRAFVGPRLIVVCLGGVSYSELRVAYDVSEATNREIIIGGTSLLTPAAFLDNLSGQKF